MNRGHSRQAREANQRHLDAAAAADERGPSLLMTIWSARVSTANEHEPEALPEGGGPSPDGGGGRAAFVSADTARPIEGLLEFRKEPEGAGLRMPREAQNEMSETSSCQHKQLTQVR